MRSHQGSYEIFKVFAAREDCIAKYIYYFLCALQLFSAIGDARAANYTVTLLNGLGGSYGYAYDINDSGLIVGVSGIAGNPASGHATLWTGGIASDLGAGGRLNSVAYGINNSGQVVGYSAGASATYATTWINGVSTDLDSSGERNSAATSINNAGQIAGYSNNGRGNDSHAIIWSNGAALVLNSLGGPDSQAASINNLGQVVGYSTTADANPNTASRHATIWRDGVTTDLGGGSFATGVDDSGRVVGYNYTATVWNSGIPSGLGTLGGQWSEALGTNNAGQVVGRSYTGTPGPEHATLWSGGAVIDLNNFLDTNYSSAGWILHSANAINSTGSIVGDAYNMGNGDRRAFLLQATSVPEAPASALLLVGLIVLAGIRRVSTH